MTQYKTGKIVKGNITGIEKYGIFVSLDNYYSGLIHISEISKNFVKDVNDYGKIGETIYARIIDVDDDLNQLKLSIKDVDYRIEKKNNRRPIKEVGNGFKELEDNLDKWIKEKIEEMK